VPAAVVYLKNRISKGWSPAEEYSQAKPIPEEEKTSFRNRLVPILVASPPQVRLQIIPTLQKILAYDFPSKWPDFLDITVQLLNAGDISSVFAGVQCLLAICKIYRARTAPTSTRSSACRSRSCSTSATRWRTRLAWRPARYYGQC
jgi:hypothetical protein